MGSLRPYQTTAVESAIQALTTIGSVVLQMPTGAGKTKAATEIIKRADKPVWFICHRQEIERQAAKAFAEEGIDFGVVSPRATPDYSKPVQIVSVATLTRRIKDMPLPQLAIWDECHHVAAKSWAAIRERLNGVQNLGLTATPERLDGKGLAEWFKELVVGPSTRDLINDGWLSDFRYFAPSEPDLAGARLVAGDYRKGDLDKAMNTPVIIGDAIAEYKKNAAGKRALVFCASVEASRQLVDRFNDASIPAAHVDGTTPAAERDEAVRRLASGDIKVLSNVEVFTEGFDLPAIDVVILLRPTKSLALFLQMIGRVLRKAHGKDVALVFDHAGLWLDHDWFDLPIEWSLDGGARERRLVGRKNGPRRCPECKEVRVERSEVCACGYEFPTGREIGEHDGTLRELRGAVPEGWENKSAFRRRAGVGMTTVLSWIDRGMPHSGHLINVSDALEWVGDNVDKDRLSLLQAAQSASAPQGYETRKDFSAKFGATTKSLFYWIEGGLPLHANGLWIDAVRGNAWVNENINLDENIRRREAKNPPRGYENNTKFMARYGLRPQSAKLWISKGMPSNGRGLVHVKPAMRWVDSNIDVKKIRQFSDRISESSKPPQGFLSQSAFAKTICKRHDWVRRWVKKGLPTSDCGRFVRVDAAHEWISDNNAIIFPAHAKKPEPVNKKTVTTFSEFARTIGVGKSTISRWIKAGLPTDGGFISVDPALAWVAVNSKIDNRPWRRTKSGIKDGYETRQSFARRIGKSIAYLNSRIDDGLPADEKFKWVHIQRGLEWVRDNTKIEIPPEAWPVGNDNQPTAAQAA